MTPLMQASPVGHAVATSHAWVVVTEHAPAQPWLALLSNGIARSPCAWKSIAIDAKPCAASCGPIATRLSFELPRPWPKITTGQPVAGGVPFGIIANAVTTTFIGEVGWTGSLHGPGR